MRRIVTAALIVVALPMAVAGIAAPRATPPPAPHKTLKPSATKVPGSMVTVELPGDLGDRFKPGPGAQVATTYCLTCHSSTYVSTQPPLDKAAWTAEVTKMRKVYAAQIPDNEAETIADYLAATYGPPPAGTR